MDTGASSAGVEIASEAEPLEVALRDLEGLADSFGRAMTTAFKSSVVEGKRLQDVLKSLALSLSGGALDRALAPIGQGIGNLVGGLFSAPARVSPFAAGGIIAGDGAPAPLPTPFTEAGIVRTPSFFPMRGGAGLMGEAGPEAILPLARGADGRLGVRAGGGGGRGLNVTFNVSTRDADSFRRSEAELTAMLARAVGRGQRGM